jgi:hypothetical protein
MNKRISPPAVRGGRFVAVFTSHNRPVYAPRPFGRSGVAARLALFATLCYTPMQQYIIGKSLSSVLTIF